MSLMLPHFYAHVIQFRFFEAHTSGDSCHICARRADPLVYLQKEKRVDLVALWF
jgi:hypothetical protein